MEGCTSGNGLGPQRMGGKLDKVLCQERMDSRFRWRGAHDREKGTEWAMGKPGFMRPDAGKSTGIFLTEPSGEVYSFRMQKTGTNTLLWRIEIE